MTQIDTSTEAVEALLDDVTEGPWLCDHCDEVELPCVEICDIDGRDRSVSIMAPEAEKSDTGTTWTNPELLAEFIAASRELVPALLAERDALQAEVDHLKAQAVTEWNEAIEVAKEKVRQHALLKVPTTTDFMGDWIIDNLDTLARPTKGETK